MHAGCGGDRSDTESSKRQAHNIRRLRLLHYRAMAPQLSTLQVTATISF
jgi:hypothetical protein